MLIQDYHCEVTGAHSNIGALRGYLMLYVTLKCVVNGTKISRVWPARHVIDLLNLANANPRNVRVGRTIG